MSQNIYFYSPYLYIRNDQMTKDTVWIPYLLYRNYGYNVNLIFCKENNDYVLMKYVKGINFLEQQPPQGKDWNEKVKRWTEFCCNHIRNNFQFIDVLYCFGSYMAYNEMIPLYKKLCPNGKVIIKLDANIKWMNDLTLQRVMNAHKNATIVTVEGKKLMKYLNQKWPVSVRYLTNGSVELDDVKKDYIAYEQKKNVILTVGRIGTEQKANQIMLEGFAKIADKIPQYIFKLIGGVEKSFEDYIKEYYARYPHLKERVLFVGRINDKKSLEKEYREAKIFCMSSIYEGGTPNVVSEAMRNGCYMVASEYDSYQEQIGFGKFGVSFPINDIKKCGEALVNATQKENIDELCIEIQKYCKRLFDYERQVAKLNYWLTH